MQAVQYLFKFLKGEKLFKISFICMLISVALMLSQPYLLSLVVKSATNESAILNDFLISLVTYIVVSLSINIFVFSDILVSTKVVSNITKKSNNYLFIKLSEKSIDFIYANNSGNIGNRIKQVSNTIKSFYMTIFQGIIIEVMLYIGFVAYISYSLPILGLAVIFNTFIYFIIGVYFGKKLKVRRVKQAESSNLLSGFIVDSIANILLMKSFSNIENESKVLEPINNKNYKHSRKFGVSQAVYGLVTRVIILVNSLLFIGIGGYMLFTKQITVDVFVGVFSATTMLSVRLRFFLKGIQDYYDYSGTIENALEKILSKNAIEDIENAKNLSFTDGDIEFNNVTFAYNKDNVFEDFNLTIKNNQKLALVGKSGAGKSTMVNLLQRFYDIDNGELLFNNQEIKSLKQESLRQNISYIPQEPGLFSRTVFENIVYGKKDATLEDVIKAAKLANAHEFIEKLPNGYDEVVGERGFKLSGGQKQRVAIARAILKDAPIIIMDEATSALDSHSEKLIQESMDSLLENKTCIIIAHRLSTIKSMDRVVVLEDGKIAQDGTHSSLVRKKGIYKELWQLQQDGFIE